MTATSDRLDRLVDPRFGPVLRVVRQQRPPELPPGFVAYGAAVADTRRFAHWQADPFASGASLVDPAAARAAAIGEAVERYCGNAVPTGLPRRTHRELAAAGIAALDPAELVLYSERQYHRPGFPYVRFTADLPVRWCTAADLDTGEPVEVPASVAHLNFHAGPYADEPATHFVILPGIAAGCSHDEAVDAALAEVCERDAVTTWWQRGAPVLGLPADVRSEVATLLADPTRDPVIDYTLFGVPSDLGVPVVGALLDDRARGIVTMGSSCHEDLGTAATKAVTEAIQLRAFSVDLLDPASPVRRGFAAGHRDARVLAEFRDDRCYLDAQLPDFAAAVDFASHAQLWLDPRMRVHLDRLHTPPDIPTAPGLPAVGSLRRHLADRGHRVLVVDLTTPDVAAAGLHVVRVLVPGLYPNAPAAVPFLGGERLYRGPAGPLDEDELVRAPLPAI
ncbi:MAG: YcaO-like family protein [Pseudonocardia sp.]